MPKELSLDSSFEEIYRNRQAFPGIYKRFQDLVRADETLPIQESLPGLDIRQKTYEILSLVRKPTKAEKEAMAQRGIVFLSTDTKSLSSVVSEDPDYFLDDEAEYVNSKQELRDYVPPVPLQVGLNPQNPTIPGSFKSKKTQLGMIEKKSKELQKEFPDARIIMLPSTVYAQADKAYKKKTGMVFFTNFFARALDATSGVDSADVGRDRPDDRLGVLGWDAGPGNGLVAAVPAVVFLRK